MVVVRPRSWPTHDCCCYLIAVALSWMWRVVQQCSSTVTKRCSSCCSVCPVVLVNVACGGNRNLEDFTAVIGGKITMANANDQGLSLCESKF
ncbi:hypothetical protein COO60DRAFT_1545562 [Scenedesmus sp. NREL 46B-D3]|nr:hypothetical protein COO60DRAFT_1545562 [Scenedesmus sp. NREL 46B-D3]